MIVTDTFSRFGRRMSSTQGWPYVVIAETENPIRQLEPQALRRRAEAMIDTVIEGLDRYLRPEGPPRGPLTEVELTGQFLLEGLRGRAPERSGEARP